MDRAREEARKGAPEGVVIMAAEQTAGRGRQGRSWYSPRGSLSLSVVFHPAMGQLPGLVMAGALAVARTVRICTRLAPVIKWPNDILLSGRKVCGILVESELQADKVAFAVVGIGLNVARDAAVSPDIAAIATSLEREAGRSLDMKDIAGELLEQLDDLYGDLRAGRPVFKEWRDSLVTLGKPVRIEHGPRMEEGLAEDVTPEGALLLRRKDGTLAEVVAGDAITPG
jgi:BirA family biotin operon repressor/biotin-[acetyl-CoA-carboxylase] ligase